jgi:hypothetical protein
MINSTRPPRHTERTKKKKADSVSNNPLLMEIKSNPEKFLSDNIIGYKQPDIDHENTIQQKGNLYSNTIFDTCYLTDDKDMQGDLHGAVTYLFTPMRSGNSDTRYSPVDKCFPGNNDLWVTGQQTGCAVCILKWPSGEYSMLHVQPRKWEDKPEIMPHLITLAKNGQEEKAVLYQESYINLDIANAIVATAEQDQEDSGADQKYPESFILVHSGTAQQKHMQSIRVVGVKGEDGEFTFFKQTVNFDTKIPCELERLEFDYFQDFPRPEPMELPENTVDNIATNSSKAPKKGACCNMQ